MAKGTCIASMKVVRRSLPRMLRQVAGWASSSLTTSTFLMRMRMILRQVAGPCRVGQQQLYNFHLFIKKEVFWAGS